MKLEDLKLDFAHLDQEQISKETIMGLLNVNKHPVLRRIRIQLMIESIAWIGFLACYYNFFDGHLKPLFWNITLVIAIGLLLVHNTLGYQITNNPINGPNIIESLRNYINKLKKYAWLSIMSRVSALIIVFGYFMSGLESFESRHYWSIGLMGLIIGIQIYFLWRIWSKRIRLITLRYEQVVENK